MLLNNLVNLFINAWSTLVVVSVILLFTRSLLFWVNYLQIKQYRIDRLWSSVQTKSFWKLFLSKKNLLLLAIFVLWQALVRPNPSASLNAFSSLTLVMHLVIFVLAINTVWKYNKKTLQIPKWTKKSLVIVLSILSIELLVVAYYHYAAEQVILIELLQPFIVFVVFTVLFIPNLFLQSKLKDKAAEKRLSLENLTVIGITGSYGKTLMKEYISFLLGEKFKLVKTPEHINVDTGIAKVVLEDLSPETEVFVVEMGAYRKGEIKSSCEVVKPTIAVMTGLGTQHIELFGSQENIEQGKFELVEAVDDESKVFANKQSEKLEKAFRTRNMHPNWYGFDQEFSPSIKYLSTAQKVTLDGAIKVAQSLGMRSDEIQKCLEKGLPTIEGTMQVKKGKSGSMIIDDSYNASTGSVIAALSDLAANKKAKKLFVFKEVIELGDIAEEEHAKIAQKAAESTTHILLLDGAHSEQMKKIILESGFSEDQLYSSETKEQFFSIADNQSVVLLEGRDAGKYLNQLV